MIFCWILALFATFLYIHLNLSDYINLKINPYAAPSKDEKAAVSVAKFKYVLLLIMAISWSIIIKFN